MAEFRYPPYYRQRKIRYWLAGDNLWAARHRYSRIDRSNEWRYSFGEPDPPDRSVMLRSLLPRRRRATDPFRFIVFADSGEGDRSQYGLLPLIRACTPDFMIINGDVAYPCARIGSNEHTHDDFLHGFFAPYKDLHIPIWATPGNHEYYSPFVGGEFYDVFCTRRFDRLWDASGLPHTVLQSGMYWELDDLEQSGLAIIGIDTGKRGNLDGVPRPIEFWKRKAKPDTSQLDWLTWRLERAQEKQGRVIVLFHIPMLAREKKAERTLTLLHSILSRYSCVRLVLCGHEHHHEQYSPATFRRFLERECVRAPLEPGVEPWLIVNGGGGGYLQSTDYPGGSYSGVRYPSARQWRGIASRLRSFSGRFFRDKGIVSRIMGTAASEIFMDTDEPTYLSFVLVEVGAHARGKAGASIRITPVFMHHLNDLYPPGYLPEGSVVDVQAGIPSPDPAKVRLCRQDCDDPASGRMDLSFEL